MTTLRISIFLNLAVLLPALTAAWGFPQHRATGHIAQAYLSPEADAAVTELLEGASLAEIATWADEVRPDRPSTAPLHYVNFPPDLDSPRAEDLANPEGNVHSAVLGYAGWLADESLPVEQRREGLKFLVHFIGDLHQPLHCGLASDRGGNDVAVLVEGERSNLHRVWDSTVLMRFHPGDDQDLANAMMKTFEHDLEVLTSAAIMVPAVWASESRVAMKAVVYPESAEDPVMLDEAYFEQGRPIAEQRLMQAGLRIAATLNAVFETGESPFAPPPASFPPANSGNFGPRPLFPETRPAG